MHAMGIATIAGLLAAVPFLLVRCVRLRDELQKSTAMSGLMRGALENTEAYIYIKDRQHKFV